MLSGLLCLQCNLLIFRTDHEELQRFFSLENPAGEDTQRIIDCVIRNRTDDHIGTDIIRAACTIVENVVKPRAVTGEALNFQARQIQLIGIQDDLLALPFLRPFPCELALCCQIKALTEISVLPSVVNIRFFDHLIAGMVNPFF